MSRTFLNQSTQISNSKVYDDTLSSGVALEFAGYDDKTIHDDLNALRSMMKQITGRGAWYEDPMVSLSSLDQWKLSLTGGTMLGNIDMYGSMVTGLAAPSAGSDAVNKDYVDSTLLAAPFRYGKQHAVVPGLITAGTDLIVNAVGGSLSVDGSLAIPYTAGSPPSLPDSTMIDNFVKYSDVYLNGQLLRYGAGKDFEFGTVPGSLVFSFDLRANDVICLISDQYTGLPAIA